MAIPNRFTPAPRPDVAEGLADMPITALVWRGLHRGHAKQHSRDAALDSALEGIAREAYRLRGIAEGLAGDGAAAAASLASIADALASRLAQLGVRVLTPVGEPFEAHLLEVFESIAQVPQPGLSGPVVGDLLEPAILRDGRVLALGKAVIHVPEQPDETPRRDA